MLKQNTHPTILVFPHCRVESFCHSLKLFFWTSGVAMFCVKMGQGSFMIPPHPPRILTLDDEGPLARRNFQKSPPRKKILLYVSYGVNNYATVNNGLRGHFWPNNYATVNYAAAISEMTENFRPGGVQFGHACSESAQ